MAEQRRQDPKFIREQLERIVSSPGFVHSERLRRFLTHCVEAPLCGRVEDLKEYTIGVRYRALFRPLYLTNLTRSWLPALEGVVEKLQRGAKVADVGCGHGASTTSWRRLIRTRH